MINRTEIAQKIDQIQNPYFKKEILPVIEYHILGLVLFLSRILGCRHKKYDLQYRGID